METNQTRKYSFKKIAKTIGKTALTIASPPLGFTSFASKGVRVSASVVGLGLNAAISIGLFSASEKIIFDSPSVKTYCLPNQLYRALPEIVFFPLAFYLDSVPTTRFEEVKIYGDNVLSFDANTQSYSLNFPPETKFKTQKGRIVSLTDTQEDVNRATSGLDTALKKGDISEARKLSDKLSEAKQNYNSINGSYEVTRTACQKIVNTMNSELKRLGEIK